LLFKESFIEAIMTSIALGVAAIPEGLPAAVTICLAVGANKMMKLGALVKKLAKIETIGFIDILCLDKTGTITKNKLEVKEIFEYKRDLRNIVVTCFNEKDPIDLAIKKYFGESKLKILETVPFSSDRKYSEAKTSKGTYRKGAPEVIIEMCELNENDKKIIYSKLKEMEEKGLKVLAAARDSEFLGLIGLLDPPRDDAEEMIKMTHKLGIETFMITGDSGRTALAIGKMVGLKSNGYILGSELKSLTKEELIKRIKSGVRIFARIEPSQKLEIVNLLKSLGKTIGMTGDGINDVLAMKRADVSIALNATDAAKETADLILINNKVTLISKAIETGRAIMDNMRKFFVYLISCNVAEVLTILIGSLIKSPILLPIHILWINLVTDGLPALGFAFDESSGSNDKSPLRGKEFLNIVVIYENLRL